MYHDTRQGVDKPETTNRLVIYITNPPAALILTPTGASSAAACACGNQAHRVVRCNCKAGRAFGKGGAVLQVWRSVPVRSLIARHATASQAARGRRAAAGAAPRSPWARSQCTALVVSRAPPFACVRPSQISEHRSQVSLVCLIGLERSIGPRRGTPRRWRSWPPPPLANLGRPLRIRLWALPSPRPLHKPARVVERHRPPRIGC